MEFQPKDTLVYGRQLNPVLSVGPNEAAARKVRLQTFMDINQSSLLWLEPDLGMSRWHGCSK
jgi:hypothetical protein